MKRKKIRYSRAWLIMTLVDHMRLEDSSCSCGWGKIDYSFPQHIADVYEETYEAKVA